MAVDETKLEPQFADGWYVEIRSDELRQEIQQLYERLREVNTELEEVETATADNVIDGDKSDAYYLDTGIDGGSSSTSIFLRGTVDGGSA